MKKMNTLKMIIVFCLLSFLIFALAACGGAKPNGLMEDASPGTSALLFYVYDGEKTSQTLLFTPDSTDILDKLDAVKATKSNSWSLDDITLPIYGLSIRKKDGSSIYAAWTNGYWITQAGDVYKFNYDFNKLENNYSSSDRQSFTGISLMPCACYLTKDKNGWSSALLTPAGELISPNGVTMTLVSWNSDTVSVNIANNSGADWIFGEPFSLQVQLDGAWYDIPPAPGNLAFHAIGLVVLSGTQRNKTYGLEMYGELPAGTYRLVAYGLAVEGTIS